MKPETGPQIVFEDQHLMVLSKPAGLLSQGTGGSDPNVVDWARDYLGRQYVGLVHRLDRNTSGLMVVAKRSKAARRLTEALKNGELRRSYLGWISGNLKSAERWKHWLLKDRKINKVSVVAAPEKIGRGIQEAVLLVSPVKVRTWKGKKLTLARFDLETGRSHQIRVQAAHEGHPLLGDSKYGGHTCFVDGKMPYRIALHSFRISFPHPISKESLRFEVKMPRDMEKIVS